MSGFRFEEHLAFRHAETNEARSLASTASAHVDAIDKAIGRSMLLAKGLTGFMVVFNGNRSRRLACLPLRTASTGASNR